MTRSPLYFALRRFTDNKAAVLCGLILLTIILMAIFAPLITLTGYADQDYLTEALAFPSTAHLMGIDDPGRDFFARITYGARISLKVGFVAVGIAVSIGTVVGLVSGYYSGLVDATLMRFVDIMLCFPAFFLILAVITIREPSIWNIMIVIGLTGWMGVARLVRAETLSIREMDYILAARCIGCSNARIIFRHILPNAI